MTIRICPSILNADRSRIFEEIEKIATADLLHLDVMDNIFVPNISFSFNDCKDIIRRSPIPVDTHLMIIDPDDQAALYAQAGSASVTFHFEASKDPRSTIRKIKATGARAGLAVKPKTTIAEVEKFFDEIDMLLIMTVEPGFGGQSFMADQLEKVQQAHETFAQLKGDIPWLQVDGGISLETIALAAKAGADTFVAGSAIYKSNDYEMVIDELRGLATV